MNIETKIWWRNGFVRVNPERPPKDERQLISFLSYNNAPNCFVKTGNAWRKITKEGKLVFVTRALYLLSLEQWLKIANNETFTTN